MKLQIAQVIGLNTDQKAAQVISSQREDNSFLAVLDISCDDAFTRGRQILSELSDFYFDFEGTPADRLKATFEEVQKKLDSDLIGVLVAAISGKVLYLMGKGVVEVNLKRSEKLSPLLSVGQTGQLISGFLQPGDRVLFSTASLVNLLAGDMSKSLELSKDEFEEEITTRMSSSDVENQGLAGLKVEVEKDLVETDSESEAQSASIPSLQKEYPQENTEDDLTDLREDLPKYSSSKLAILTPLKNAVTKLPGLLPKSNKGRLIVAACLIVIIVLGIGFKVKSVKDAQKLAHFKQALQEAQDNFNAAKGIATLNAADAKNKLDAANSKLNEALALKPSDETAQNLKKQIENESPSILLQSSVSDFPLFLDMDLVKKNFRATQLSLSNGKLLLLDPAVKTLATIDISKKSNQILGGAEQLGEASVASLNGGLAFIYSKDKGILKVDITNQKITQAVKKDSELLEVKDIYGFGGNIYLLDLGKNMIWKNLATADGYSEKKEYLTSGVKADFSNAVRMQIESSIYVLKKDGEMQRFTRGAKDNFSYGGLDKGIKDPKSFFVSSDTDNLYILDSGNSRLVILTKTGGYKGQITGAEFAQATDLVVDEKDKKIYLLDGSKIFQVDLK